MIGKIHFESWSPVSMSVLMWINRHSFVCIIIPHILCCKNVFLPYHDVFCLFFVYIYPVIQATLCKKWLVAIVGSCKQQFPTTLWYVLFTTILILAIVLGRGFPICLLFLWKHRNFFFSELSKIIDQLSNQILKFEWS